MLKLILICSRVVCSVRLNSLRPKHGNAAKQSESLQCLSIEGAQHEAFCEDDIVDQLKMPLSSVDLLGTFNMDILFFSACR